RIANARAKGKVLDLSQKRPLSDSVHFKLFHPALDPTQPPVCREFDWPVFENAPFDKTTAEEIKASQILIDGIPLHCLPSARNLDPTIRPSSQQSAVAVATRAEFEALSPDAQQELHRFRSVLILDSADSLMEPEFNREFLEMYRDIDQDCEIQDPGLRTLQSEDIVRIGPLSSLLDHTAREGTVILNALQNPLPYANIDLPPGWANHATHERAANHTPAQAKLPPPLMPWEDLRWIIFAMRYAKSAAHQDVLSTVLKMLCGWKLWAIALRADGAPDSEGDFSSRFAFRGWNPKLSNCGYLRAGTIHFVVSITDCAAAGLHSHCASSLSSGIWCSLHNVITDSATTNADHATARSLLVRIFIYQARQIVARKPQIHVPDITKNEQLFDLVNLICFVILFPALSTSSYAYMQHGMLLMQEDRHLELMYAWKLLTQLITFVDEHASFTSAEFDTFDSLVDTAVVHTASCLDRYMKDWQLDVERSQGFTHSAFRKQLGRSLAAYDSYSITQDPAQFQPATHKSGLQTEFNGNCASEAEYSHFVPWTAATMPCTIQLSPPSPATTPPPPPARKNRKHSGKSAR
ncbi:hypothetical protein C8R47DRAFT_1230612, partial [Mycena vitilis]